MTVSIEGQEPKIILWLDKYIFEKIHTHTHLYIVYIHYSPLLCSITSFALEVWVPYWILGVEWFHVPVRACRQLLTTWYMYIVKNDTLELNPQE